jgi:ABC-type sulfate transport system permease subunit
MHFVLAAEEPVPQVICFVVIIELFMGIFIIAGMWKAFDKAYEPGWAAIVPIYNAVVALRIAGKPLWWILPLCIPIVNLFFGVMMLSAIARAFRKGSGYTIGLVFLPFVFWPMLGFGKAKYVGY